MKNKMTLILFSGELDKALAGFNLATAAASMGMEVVIFFTFWGLNILRKEKSLTRSASGGLKRKLFGIFNKGGADNLPLSRFHFAGIGTKMMKQLMKEMKFPSLYELMKLAKSLGVRFVACTTTMGMMGLTKDDLIPEVDEYVGAATYLINAQESRINLFL